MTIGVLLDEDDKMIATINLAPWLASASPDAIYEIMGKQFDEPNGMQLIHVIPTKPEIRVSNLSTKQLMDWLYEHRPKVAETATLLLTQTAHLNVEGMYPKA